VCSESARLQFFFTHTLPLLLVAFMILWHAGLGQPGVLRATIMGQIVFYSSTFLCYIEVSRLLRNMDAESRVSVHWRVLARGTGSALWPAKGIPAGSSSSSALPSSTRRTSTRRSSPTWRAWQLESLVASLLTRSRRRGATQATASSQSA
jgi:hypothetical protein